MGGECEGRVGVDGGKEGREEASSRCGEGERDVVGSTREECGSCAGGEGAQEEGVEGHGGGESFEEEREERHPVVALFGRYANRRSVAPRESRFEGRKGGRRKGLEVLRGDGAVKEKAETFEGGHVDRFRVGKVGSLESG